MVVGGPSASEVAVRMRGAGLELDAVTKPRVAARIYEKEEPIPTRLRPALTSSVLEMR